MKEERKIGVITIFCANRELSWLSVLRTSLTLNKALFAGMATPARPTDACGQNKDRIPWSRNLTFIKCSVLSRALGELRYLDSKSNSNSNESRFLEEG